MSKQLQILAGVAMFATLALAGALGIFAFSGAQPVHAQASSDVTRMLSATEVATEGSVDVTITLNTGLAVDVTETLPADWDYQSVSPSSVDVAEIGQMISFSVISGEPVTYTVMAPDTDGCGMFSGMFAALGSTPSTMIGGATDVTVGAGCDGNGGTMPMPSGDYSVMARPTDPGAVTQITIRFENPSFLEIDDSITLEVEDDLDVPSSINAGDVSIAGDGAESASDTDQKQPSGGSSRVRYRGVRRPQ